MKINHDEYNDLRDYLYSIIDKVHDIQDEMSNDDHPLISKWLVDLNEIAHMADMADGCALWMGVDPEPDED